MPLIIYVIAGKNVSSLDSWIIILVLLYY